MLCSYETLRGELPWAEEGRTGGRRHRKRYARARCPLTAVGWWRLCLDEAQMVEGGSSKAAEMARRLSARHCWCVTGTPIQRSFADLAGLLTILHLDRRAYPFWWQKDIWEPYTKKQLGPALRALRAQTARPVARPVAQFRR